jgi:uncharacterized protein (UPF0332 family)
MSTITTHNALSTPLERGQEELAAAQVLLDAGFPSQALSRACAAALNAARAALLAIGEAPSTSAGVVSAFARRVVTDDTLEPDHARTLRKLFEDRNDVDHALGRAPAAEADEAILAAKILVNAAARFIDERARRDS